MKSKNTILLFSVFLVLLPSNLLAKNIQRSCSAHYEIETSSGVISPTPLPAIGGDIISIKLGHFSAKGSCGGKRVANRCRERARNAAQQCMAEHWEVPSREGDRGSAPCTGTSIVNYPISSEYLGGVIQDWVCDTFRAESMVVRVKAVTTGDKGCSKSSVLSSNYRINCN